jgi:2-dehydro-3-deoxyphosphogluconate aldolase / (4S)-4-hydroxy-2-oxoglutarate aldolase
MSTLKISIAIDKETPKVGNQKLSELLAGHKVIPVIQIDHAEDAVALAQALYESGIKIAEITLRSPVAIDAIANIHNALPQMVLCAGTILNADQADKAMAAGAQFLVAPGLNPRTVIHCQDMGYPFIAGINNPSQVEQALELGLTKLKFFPAEASGGVAMVKSLLAPYVGIELMPTGGIHAENIEAYLALDRVLCCGGSWMVSPDLIKSKKWTKIRKLSKEIVTQLS